jgi:hypothetical protein
MTVLISTSCNYKQEANHFVEINIQQRQGLFMIGLHEHALYGRVHDVLMFFLLGNDCHVGAAVLSETSGFRFEFKESISGIVDTFLTAVF